MGNTITSLLNSLRCVNFTFVCIFGQNINTLDDKGFSVIDPRMFFNDVISAGSSENSIL